MKRKILSILTVAALTASLSACSNESSSSAVAGTTAGDTSTAENTSGVQNAENETNTSDDAVSTIYVATTATLDAGLDPFNGFGSLNYGVYEALFAYGFDGGYEPEILESYTLSDDGYSMEITIKDDVYTVAGDNITSEDVLWSAEQVLSGSNARFISYLDLENSEIIDEYTFVFAFNSEWMDFNFDGLCHMPITSKTTYENSADHLYSKGEGTTGAYRIESYTEGVEVVLVKNENYHSSYHEQNVDRIVVKSITDAAQRLIAYENNEVDFIEPDTNDLEYINTLAGTQVIGTYDCKSLIIGLNSVEEGSPLQDVRVRQAVVHAVNNQEISDAVYNGLTLPATGVVSPLVKEWDDDYYSEYYTYDPELSKELLAEAGYPDGLSLSLAYGSENEDLAVILKAELAQVGINVILQAYESAAYTTLLSVNEGWELSLTEYKVEDTVLFNFYNKVNVDKQIFGGWTTDEFQSILNENLYNYNADDVQKLIAVYEENVPQYTIVYKTKQYVLREGVNYKTAGDNFVYPGDWTYDESSTSWLYD